MSCKLLLSVKFFRFGVMMILFVVICFWFCFVVFVVNGWLVNKVLDSRVIVKSGVIIFLEIWIGLSE